MIDRLHKSLFRLETALVLAVALGFLFRVSALGKRPMHPAESMRATLSFQWHENSEVSYYKYQPEHQGPFLYEVTRVLFAALGVGTTEARVFPVLFGLFLVFSPLLFRPWLGRRERWLAVGAVALSPLLVYYSRFLGSDLAAVASAAVAVACGARAVLAMEMGDLSWARRWLFGAAAAAGVLFATSAVAYLYALVLASFAFLHWASRRFSIAPLRGLDPVSAEALARTIFLATACFFLVFALLATSFFKHPDGFLDVLYRKSLPYWWGLRATERAPITYPLRMILLHDPWIALGALLAAGSFVARARHGRLFLAGVVAIGLATVPFAWGAREALSSLATALKIKDSNDIFIYVLAAGMGLRSTFAALAEGRRFEALLAHWAFTSLALYGWLGDKAPWLSVHVLYPAVLLAASWAPTALSAARLRVAERFPPLAGHLLVAAIAIVPLWQARLAWFVSVETGGATTNLLADEHLSDEARDVAHWMASDALETGERAEGIPLAFLGSPSWPFFFYLIDGGFKRFVFETTQLTGKERFVVADEPHADQVRAKLRQEGYREARLPFLGGWGPDHATWAEWFRYAVWRKPVTPGTAASMVVFHRPIDGKRK